tara:strand:- start:747 stop:905 length:159 start_codon:yes stop_codon:yes gene_type:complete
MQNRMMMNLKSSTLIITLVGGLLAFMQAPKRLGIPEIEPFNPKIISDFFMLK